MVEHVRHRAFAVASTAALTVAITLAGCGGGDGQSEDNRNAKTAPGARVIKVDGRSFEYDPSTIQIDTGEDVAISLHSEDAFHDFEVEGEGFVVGADPDETALGGLRIDKPGRYTFFCTVAGHRNAGMEGTIVVS